MNKKGIIINMQGKIILMTITAIIVSAFAFNAEVISFAAVIAIGAVSAFIAFLFSNKKVKNKYTNSNTNKENCINSKSA